MTKHLQEVGIPLEVQRVIIERVLNDHRNTCYHYEVQIRVHKKIGSEKPLIEQLQKDFIHCEKAVDAFTDELQMLDAAIDADRAATVAAG